MMWLLLSGSNRCTVIITAFMGYARCGMLFAVRVSVLDVSKQLA